jgi:pilus assembly protein Flp/PilA
MEKVIRFFKDEEGVTAIEYGLIAALIAVFIIVALGLVGGGLDTIFRRVATALTSV